MDRLDRAKHAGPAEQQHERGHGEGANGQQQQIVEQPTTTQGAVRGVEETNRRELDGLQLPRSGEVRQDRQQDEGEPGEEGWMGQLEVHPLPSRRGTASDTGRPTSTSA